MDLARDYESGPKHANGNGKRNGHATTNGMNGHGNEYPSTGPLHTVLSRLLQAGIIEPLNASMLRSPTDLYNTVEKEVLTTFFGGSTKGGKQKDELKIKIQARLESARTEGPDWQPKGKKRMANGDYTGVNGNKRRRLSNGSEVVNGDQLYEDDGTRLDVGLSSF